MGDVSRSLRKILQRHASNLVEHDPEWTSPCEVGDADGEGMIKWQPVAMQPQTDFADVEMLVGLLLHADVKEFYGSYWAGSVSELQPNEL